MKKIKTRDGHYCEKCKDFVVKNSEMYAYRRGRKWKWVCVSCCEKDVFTPAKCAERIKKTGIKPDKFLDDVKKELEKPKIWSPENQEVYYYCASGGVFYMTYKGCRADIWRLLSNNVFKTYELASKYLGIDMKIREIAAKFPVNWSNEGEVKFYFSYNISINQVVYNRIYNHYDNGVVCGGKGFIEAVRKDISDEDLIFYFSKGATW